MRFPLNTLWSLLLSGDLSQIIICLIVSLLYLHSACRQYSPHQRKKMESASVALYKRKLKQKVSLLNCWALVFLCMYIGFMSDKKVSWTSSSHFYATKKKKWRRYIFFILSSLLLVRWLVQTCWENLLDVIGMKNSFSLYFLNNKIKVIK